MEKVCKCCDKKYTPTSGLNTKYCDHCRATGKYKNAYTKKEIKRHCGYCGEIFTVTHIGSKISRLNYCSDECAKANRHSRTVKSIRLKPVRCDGCLREIKNPKPNQRYCNKSCSRRNQYLPRHCMFCGALFQPKVHQQITCCKKHSQLWNSWRTSKVKYEQRFISTCVCCGNEITGRTKGKKYCSVKCQSKHERDNLTDNYILGRINAERGRIIKLDRKEIPETYIEAKRAQLKLLRATK